jgi:hypothetical protein
MRLRFWLKGLSTVAALLVSSALLVAATDQGQVGPPSSASRNEHPFCWSTSEHRQSMCAIWRISCRPTITIHS